MLGQIASALRSRRAIESLWLYLVILIPTLGFKVHYLNRMVVGGIDSMADELLADSTWWAFLGSDILEVAVLTACIVLSLALVPERKRPLIAIPAVITAYIWMIANWISVKELSTLMTPNSLLISLSWVIDNPEHIKSYVHGRREMLLAMLKAAGFISLSALPYCLARQMRLAHVVGKANPAIFIVTAVSLTAVAAEAGIVRSSLDEPLPEPFRGYWSSSIRAMFLSSTSDLLTLEVPTRERILSDYEALTQHPTTTDSSRTRIAMIPEAHKRPRHIVVISLETAPQKYYPIAHNPTLPNFYRMSQQAITSTQHYANAPFTTWAIYSMLTGTYPNPGGRLERYGPFETDGLAAVLRREGYRTTFIDSYKIDWIIGMSTHTVMWRRVGFDTLLDNTDQQGRRNLYETKVESETRSFDKVVDAIDAAEAEGRKSLSFVATLLGHYRWPARVGSEGVENTEKLARIAKEFDDLVGRLLDTLEAKSILNDTIILITGDHGLRYQNEYASLAEPEGDAQVSFKVPFLLFAPGLLDAPVKLDLVTSHIDITPTLLDLVGVKTSGMLHHGKSVLNPAINDRITFFMNTRLSSTDWLHWNGQFVSHNWLTGKTDGSLNQRGGAVPPQSAADIFAAANQLFSISAGYALQRADKEPRTRLLMNGSKEH